MGRSKKHRPTHDEVVELLSLKFNTTPTQADAQKVWPKEWARVKTLVHRGDLEWRQAVKAAKIDRSKMENQCAPPLCRNEATMEIEIARIGTHANGTPKTIPVCSACYELEMKARRQARKLGRTSSGADELASAHTAHKWRVGTTRNFGIRVDGPAWRQKSA